MRDAVRGGVRGGVRDAVLGGLGGGARGPVRGGVRGGMSGVMSGVLRGGSMGRLLAACSLMDGAFYMILTAVPLRAIELGASAVQLGILPVLGSGVYVAAALLFGSLSDRVPRLRMARAGALVRVGAAVGLTTAGSVTELMAWMPLLGIANGLYWPALQASIGESRAEGQLGRSLGAFNVSWSTGKMLGFFTAGAMVTTVGDDATLLFAGALTALVAILLPSRLDPAADAGPETALAAAAHDDRKGAAVGAAAPRIPAAGPEDGTEHAARIRQSAHARRTWRGIGWTANFVLFGIGATLNFHYPKLLLSLGFTGADFGVYLGAIYFFQTLAFVVLTRWDGWQYRAGPLVAVQAVTTVCVLLLGGLDTRALIWATAPGIGLGLGLSYSSSIYYSLFREEGRGRNSGIHEALLGSGTFLLPFLGGVAADITGSLRAPYFFAAAVLGAAMVVELSAASRSRAAREEREKAGPR